jgi:hypothetical protein
VSTRGDRSCLAALELELAGFTEVQSLAGGLQRWIELGLPVAFAPSLSDEALLLHGTGGHHSR